MKALCMVPALIAVLASCAYAASQPSRVARTVIGTVVDADGKPIPGAILEVSRAGTFKWTALSTSDATGQFNLPIGKGMHLVTAMAPGHAATSSLVEHRPDSTPAALRLVLAKGGIPLTGKVLDPQERLVSKGEVWAQNLGTFNAAHIFHTTLKDGSFSLSLPPGGYRLFGRFPGFSLSRQFVNLKAPTQVTLHALTPPGPAGSEVLAWIRQKAIPLRTAEPDGNSTDLEPIGSMIGNAKLVGLGEATHGTHEFQTMKHRIVEYLVAKKGFTVFAIEEDFNDATILNDYVVNGKGNPEKTLSKLDVQWWDTEEVLSLLRWMRNWNADGNHPHKVSFWGMDNRSFRGPYQVFHPWLVRAMPAFAERMKAEGVDEEFANLVTDNRRKASKEQIQKARNLMRSLLSELDAYAKSHPAEALDDIRLNVEMGRNYLDDVADLDNWDTRDRLMAENTLAFLARAGHGAKGIVWAHNGHVASKADRNGTGTTVTMGQHFRRALGSDYFAFGFTFDRGTFLAYDAPFFGVRGIMAFEVGPASVNSIDAAFAKVHQSTFVLNLRALPDPGPAKAWFDQERPMWSLGGGFNPLAPEYTIHAPEVSAPSAYDALIHIERTTPIRLNATRWSIADLPLPGKIPAPTNLNFKDFNKDGVAKGWQTTAYGSAQASQESTSSVAGKALAVSQPDSSTVVTMHPFKDAPDRVPVLAQVVDPASYRGKTVILTAWVQKGDGAGEGEIRLWGRVRRSQALGDYQVDLRKISEQNGWAKLEVEVNVASDATELAYGLSLIGPSAVQVRDFSIKCDSAPAPIAGSPKSQAQVRKH